MIECVATDVATMMVDVTEIQGEVERASGSRLDSSSGPATGVKTALHKLVTKYAGGEVAERLLGAPAKPRRLVTPYPHQQYSAAYTARVPAIAALLWYNNSCQPGRLAIAFMLLSVQSSVQDAA